MKRTIISSLAIATLCVTISADEGFTLPEEFLLHKAPTACLTQCCETLSSRAAQTYTYYQNTGHFIGGTGEWHIDTRGYSGSGQGLMNPTMQCVSNVGPLPAARYKLGYCKNTMHTPAVTRPCSFYLEPQEPSKMCGRSAFFVHGCQCCTSGDHSTPPVAGCSAGCIVINQDQRIKLRVGDTVNVIQYENKQSMLEDAPISSSEELDLAEPVFQQNA